MERVDDFSKQHIALQLRSINSQFNPHLTLNAFSSISGMIRMNKDHDVIDEYIYHLSRILFIQMDWSNHATVSLKDELTLIDHFFHLQSFRYPLTLSWEVTADNQECLSTHIPKTIVYNHVENAIKYGIASYGHGDIKVDVSLLHDFIQIEIKNSVREEVDMPGSEPIPFGQGMDIQKEILELYFQLSGKQISESINIRSNEKGYQIGAQVVIKIPIK
ncbi:MAG: histidine kinase [Bacteroidales bacterium]|nr:histidine kinase [Bacteroidales bacterium]